MVKKILKVLLSFAMVLQMLLMPGVVGAVEAELADVADDISSETITRRHGIFIPESARKMIGMELIIAHDSLPYIESVAFIEESVSVNFTLADGDSPGGTGNGGTQTGVLVYPIHFIITSEPTADFTRVGISITNAGLSYLADNALLDGQGRLYVTFQMQMYVKAGVEGDLDSLIDDMYRVMFWDALPFSPPPTPHTVTMRGHEGWIIGNDGSRVHSKEFYPGEIVTIEYYPFSSHFSCTSFSHWEANPSVEFANKNSFTTTFIMPNNDVEIVDRFISICRNATARIVGGLGRNPLLYYWVNNPDDLWADRTWFRTNSTFELKANEPEEGYRFVRWESDREVVFEDVTASVTTVVMPDSDVIITAVFEPIQECQIVVEGQFANQSGVNGIAGAPWRLCEDGRLEVDEGFINTDETWISYSSRPWKVPRDRINHIVFTGPIIAGTSLSGLFAGLYNVTDIEGLTYFDTSSVTDMSLMFGLTMNLKELDVSNWDTSSVTDMSSMFGNARNLTELDVSNWDTSSVTDMSSMFSWTESLIELDVSNWDTSSVTNMGSMFRAASGLTSLDVSNWDTSSVTDMSSMFSWTESLIELDVSNWDTSSVTNMGSMFRAASGLTSLDVSNWDTSSVTNMSLMFNSATSLTELDMSSWDTSSVTNMDFIFFNTSSLSHITFGPNFISQGNNSLPNVVAGNGGSWRNIRTGETFQSGPLWSHLSIHRQNTYTWVWNALLGDVCFDGQFADQPNGIAGAVWRLCDGILEIDEGFINWTLYNGPWHAHRAEITHVVITGPITAGASLRSLFRDFQVTEIEGLTYFDTSRTTNMENMFRSASALAELDLSSFDTSRVTNMTRMFTNTHTLRELTLGSQFSFTANAGLPVLSQRDEYTGMWQNGEFVLTSAQLMSQFDGLMMAGTFVWQIRGEDECVVVARGRFNHQTGVNGILGAPWHLCEDGTLEIGEGFINWTLYQGPWHDYRNEIAHVVITGPITGGLSLRSLFRDLNQVTEIEGLTYFDTSRTTNMENMFRTSSALVELDLSSFDTRNVTNMTRMFTNTTALRELTLGENFRFAGNAGLPEIRPTDEYTGLWRLAEGIYSGRFVVTSFGLMTDFNFWFGFEGAGRVTFVWERTPTIETVPRSIGAFLPERIRDFERLELLIEMLCEHLPCSPYQYFEKITFIEGSASIRFTLVDGDIPGEIETGGTQTGVLVYPTHFVVANDLITNQVRISLTPAGLTYIADNGLSGSQGGMIYFAMEMQVQLADGGERYLYQLDWLLSLTLFADRLPTSSTEN